MKGKKDGPIEPSTKSKAEYFFFISNATIFRKNAQVAIFVLDYSYANNVHIL